MDNNLPQNTQPYSAPTQPIQYQVPSVPQAKTNSLLILTIVMTTAIAFGALGYYFGTLMPLTFLQPKTSITPDIAITPQITPETTPQTTPSITGIVTPTAKEADLMFNTTSYSNKDYGFGFNYPSDWKLSKSPSTYLNLILTPPNQTQEVRPPIQISIDSALDTNGQQIKFLSVQEAEVHYTNSISKASLVKKNINVANKVAVSLVGVSSDVDGPGAGTKQNFTLIQLSNKVLVIQLNDATLQNNLNLILSTFSLI